MSKTEQSDFSQIVNNSELLIEKKAVDSSMEKMSKKIEAELGDKNLIILTIMNGGLYPTALFMRYFQSNCELDYIHLSRYGNKTTGGLPYWHRKPQKNIKNRNVLVIDDILDQGITLGEAIRECHDSGAKSVYSAVMVKKNISIRKGIQESDFYAINLPNKYLFGSGLDYHGQFRNLDGIFALNRNGGAGQE